MKIIFLLILFFVTKWDFKRVFIYLTQVNEKEIKEIMIDNTFLTGTRALEKKIILGDPKEVLKNLILNKKNNSFVIEKINIPSKLKIQTSF